MALLKKLKEVQKANTKRNSLHLQFLQTYSDHGHGASMSESLGFLQQLRKAREDVREYAAKRSPADVKRQMQRWSAECIRHDGFTRLREKLLDAKKLEALHDSDLSRVYNCLLRLGFSQEADEIWPKVSARIANGRLKDGEALLGLWTVAPVERLPDLDTQLAQAFRTREPPTWQLISAVSRAFEHPNSKVTRACAEKLTNRLQDLSSDDLARVGFQVGARLARDENLDPSLQGLAKNAKTELLSRDGTLDAQQLCGMLGALEGLADPLWPSLKEQLLSLVQKKDSLQFSTAQALEVMRFLCSNSALEREQQLYRGAAAQFRKSLKSADPEIVVMLSKNLEYIMGDLGATQAVLNLAVRLRQDLYPSVLWKLFVRCGQAGLVKRHPACRVRLHRIGEILEEHGIRRKMALAEMGGIVEAMRANDVILHKSIQQMSKQFVNIHAEIIRDGSGHGSDTSTVTEIIHGSGSEVDGTSGDTNWLGEVQRLMVDFWVKFDTEDETLSATIQSFCQQGGCCSIDARFLAQCISQLGTVAGASSSADGSSINDSTSRSSIANEFATGLAAQLAEKLPQLSQRQLIEAAAAASALSGGECRGMLWHKILEDLDRRLSPGSQSRITGFRRLVDFDDAADTSIALRAAFKQQLAEVRADSHWLISVLKASDLSHRIGRLLTESLPLVSKQEPAAFLRRLTVFCHQIAALDPVSREMAKSAARSCLHRVAHVGGIDNDARDTFRGASELAFGFTILSAGDLPLDVAARLAQRLGDSLGAFSHSEGGISKPAEEAVNMLSRRQAAELLVFLLCMRHLQSRTAFTALSLAPEAPNLDALLQHLQRKSQTAKSKPVFNFQVEPAASTLVGMLQASIAEATPGTLSAEHRLCQQRFEIPGTPYVADFAWPDRRKVIIVPRTEHCSAEVDKDGLPRLSASAILMQSLLKALGWTVQWIYASTWESRLSLASAEKQEGKGMTDSVIAELLGDSVPDAGAAETTET